jgi:hypothetical protein
MVQRARPHNRKTSQKRRRQMSSVSTVSTTTIKGGKYRKVEPMATLDRTVTADCPGAENCTTVQTRENYTIHAAGESLCVRMKGCNESELRRRIAQLQKHVPGYSMTKKNGIRYLDGIGRSVIDGRLFRPPWIEFVRIQIPSKQSGNSGHLERVERIRPEYRTSELDDEEIRELYGDHRPRRLNRGSKSGSRERMVDELPTVNEIGRKEAESDGIEEYEMPVGGHIETARSIERAKAQDGNTLEDYHQKHVDNLPV